MKKALFTFALVLLAVAAQAQLKIHDDGHISLGSLTKNHGLQVGPDGYVYFQTQYSDDGSWATLSFSNNNYQKHWIVSNLANVTDPGKQTFFVYGNGGIFCRGTYIWGGRDLSESSNIENAGAVLDGISGIWYIPTDESIGDKAETKRCIGLSAQEVESALPEAVSSDESGDLYINYDALTVFLIEAVKEQRREIEILRKSLEEHGLIEPEKP